MRRIVLHQASFDLIERVTKSLFEAFLSLSPSLNQPVFERLKGRREDEESVGLGVDIDELLCSLDVDVKQRNPLIVLNVEDRLLIRSIEVVVDSKPLDEPLFVYHLLELVLLNEVVGHSILFTRPWLSSGIADREAKAMRVLLSQSTNQGRFSNS